MVILKKASESEKMSVQGHKVAVTNLDKIYWPEEKYTKGDVIAFYHNMAPTILPYLKDRPMVLRRNPHGITEPGFFQKDTSDMHLPPWIKTTTITHEKGDVRYLMVQDEAALIYVANLGCIELNPFISRAKYLAFPDYLIWDLDPEDISFNQVVDVALELNEILEQIQVKGYCKTSGGRGLHIYVPLGAKYTYEQVQNFARLIAVLVNKKLPKITSLERMPANRQKKVYIDTLQNEHTKTVAAPYCLRPKPHAPVATPLKWSEVKHGLKPEAFNIRTIHSRLIKVGDIFKPVLGPGIDLKKCLRLLDKLLL